MHQEIYEDNSTFDEYKEELKKYKNKTIQDILSPEEIAELKEYPVGSTSVLDGFTHYTDKNIVNIRCIIAKKLTKMVFANDSTMTDEFLRIYHKFPMWKFYTGKNDKSIVRRSYGIGLNEKKEYVLLMASCMHILTNLVINGVSLDKVEPVEYWSEDQLSKIISNMEPFPFIDPLGYYTFVNTAYK